MIYIVSYDFGPQFLRDVTPFLNELQRTDNGRDWWHFLTNAWLIATNESPQQLYTRLQPSLRDNDRLLIMGVTGDYTGFLPKEAWGWIEQKIATNQLIPQYNPYNLPVGAISY